VHWTLTLVLEGGGVKGIGLVPSLTLVDTTTSFHRIAGTSAGAIVGADRRRHAARGPPAQ
jgi:predicted acylesterase/phospholipase RssA